MGQPVGSGKLTRNQVFICACTKITNKVPTHETLIASAGGRLSALCCLGLAWTVGRDSVKTKMTALSIHAYMCAIHEMYARVNTAASAAGLCQIGLAGQAGRGRAE